MSLFEKELNILESKFFSARTMEELQAVIDDPIHRTVEETGDRRDKRQASTIGSDAARNIQAWEEEGVPQMNDTNTAGG